MKITFNYYSDFYELPKPTILFDLTRCIDAWMRKDSQMGWEKIKRWARPMNQLRPGIFMNISEWNEEDIKDFLKNEKMRQEDNRLELQMVGPGYARITFFMLGNHKVMKFMHKNTSISDPIPYKITNATNMNRKSG